MVDPIRDRLLLIGGTQYLASVPALSLGATPAWSTLAASGGPIVRQRPSAIYDPPRDRIVMFGGMTQTSDFYQTYDGLWQLTLGATPTWTELTPAGTIPPGRADHTAIYDPVHDRMIVYGGITDPDGECCGQTLGDTWELSLAATPTWTQLIPLGGSPGGRSGHSAVYDPARAGMVVFGGAATDTVWALSLSPGESWTALLPVGAGPAPRSSHVAIFDADVDRMVVFGGGDIGAPTIFGDAWELRFGAPRPGPAPPATSLALLGSQPNPAVGLVRVALRLADGRPARLELYDLSGRRVARRDLDGLGAGMHAVTLTETSGLKAGVYLLKLEQSGRIATGRAVLIR